MGEERSGRETRWRIYDAEEKAERRRKEGTVVADVGGGADAFFSSITVAKIHYVGRKSAMWAEIAWGREEIYYAEHSGGEDILYGA